MQKIQQNTKEGYCSQAGQTLYFRILHFVCSTCWCSYIYRKRNDTNDTRCRLLFLYHLAYYIILVETKICYSIQFPLLCLLLLVCVDKIERIRRFLWTMQINDGKLNLLKSHLLSQDKSKDKMRLSGIYCWFLRKRIFWEISSKGSSSGKKGPSVSKVFVG